MSWIIQLSTTHVNGQKRLGNLEQAMFSLRLSAEQAGSNCLPKIYHFVKTNLWGRPRVEDKDKE